MFPTHIVHIEWCDNGPTVFCLDLLKNIFAEFDLFRYDYYEADAVNCSGNHDKEMTYWAYEWRNPRFGIKIKEIRLEGSSYRAQSTKLSTLRDGELIGDNAVALIALSCVTKRDNESSKAKISDVK